MEEQELLKSHIETNRMIAIFMGWNEKESGRYPIMQFRYNDKGVVLDSSKGRYLGNTPLYMYHQSLDWLMPVVED